MLHWVYDYIQHTLGPLNRKLTQHYTRLTWNNIIKVEGKEEVDKNVDRYHNETASKGQSRTIPYGIKAQTFSRYVQQQCLE